jgi:hypothetical protein
MLLRGLGRGQDSEHCTKATLGLFVSEGMVSVTVHRECCMSDREFYRKENNLYQNLRPTYHTLRCLEEAEVNDSEGCMCIQTIFILLPRTEVTSRYSKFITM